jgi:hypothetical protein
MRRVLVLFGIAVVCIGCGGKSTAIPPGSRLIMQGNKPLYTVCDRGNRLYVSEAGPVQIVPLGCLDGQP